jgi:DNA-binding transcriptional LysR family regulator
MAALSSSEASFVFDELLQGIKEIESIADPTAGEVRIGATSTIAEVGIVVAVIDRISQQYPHISFSCRGGYASNAFP